MDNKTAYTKKAEAYARYRWDYAPQAVDTIIQGAGITPAAWVADIGSGTGILTRHLAGKAEKVFAIELNYAMQFVAQRVLTDKNGCIQILAPAEATALPTHSVDLITVAQAIHWFSPVSARSEFRRILKPGGWLAILRNIGIEDDATRATYAIWTPENGVTLPAAGPSREPVSESYYFAPEKFQKLTFPFTIHENYETFLGAMLSASFMPDEDHPCFPKLAAAAQAVFNRFSNNGLIAVHGITELYLGQME